MKKKFFKVILLTIMLAAIIPMTSVKAAGAEAQETKSYGHNPVDFQVDRVPVAEIAAVKALPAKYVPANLLNESLFPAVRDQSPYGTCWAHATIALAELSVNKNESKLEEYSELQTAYFMYHYKTDPLGGTVGDVIENNTEDTFLDMGGNLVYSTNLLAGWVGATDEAKVPYENAYDSLTNGVDEKYAYDDMAHLRNAFYINTKDRDVLKDYIAKYGGAGVNYYERLAYASGSGEDSNYYCDVAATGNHAVTIVGWDDNFSKTKFKYTPEGDGAWLIRNSWGDNAYSHNGYFWMSYYDKSLENVAYVYDFVSSTNPEYYDNNYQYDGSAYKISMYMYDKYTDKYLKAANIFTASYEKEVLKAVSFGSRSVDLTYTIKIYKGLTNPSDPTSGTLASTMTGKTLLAGIHNVKLNNTVELTTGEKYSVVVELKTSGGNAPVIDIEYSTSATNWIKTIGSSYYGQGMIENGYRWLDMCDYNSYGGNLGIKAFTNTVKDTKKSAAYVEIYTPVKELEIGNTAKLEAIVRPAHKENQAVTWSSSNPSVVSVDQNGVVTGKAYGTAIITAKAPNGVTGTYTFSIQRYVESVELKYNMAVSVGNTIDANDAVISISPSNATEKLTFRSSDSTIATVDSKGIIKGVKAGAVIIYVDGKCLEQQYFILTVDPKCSHKNTVYSNKIPANFKKDGQKAYYYCKDCRLAFHDKKCTNRIINIADEVTIPKLKTVKLSKSSYSFDGKAKAPTVEVKDSKGKLVASSNYTITKASGRKNVGSYTYKISFKNDYTGSKSITFTINPKGTSVSKVTAGSGRLTINWKKQATQADGYELYLATDKNFKKNLVKVTVSKNSTVKKTVSKLKKKTGYYIRIRTFKKVKDKTYYSAWSQFDKVVKTK